MPEFSGTGDPARTLRLLWREPANVAPRGPKPGLTVDRVVTSAGIHGMITNVKEKTVTVKVADNVKVEMEKSAVTNVLKE